MDITVPVSNGFSGTFTVPGDKSISHRALLLSAIARGTSEILNCSTAADPLSTRTCLENLGIEISEEHSVLKVKGQGLRGFRQPSHMLDAGNSGTTIRLLSGILVGQSFPSSIAGDESLNKRPMKRIIEPLRQMGANIVGTEHHTAPLYIRPVPQLTGIDYTLPVASAQVKSAILLAGLYAEGETVVREHILTRNHTERMLGLVTKKSNDQWVVSVRGGMEINAQQFTVPGDISAAAFLMVAASIVPKSEIIIKNVGLNPTRTAIIDILRSLGADIRIENQNICNGEELGDLWVRSSEFHGTLLLKEDIVAQVIDEIPILAVAALFSDGLCSIRGAAELRKKESDRITAIVTNLRALGVDVEEYEDGFSFEPPKQFRSATIDSYYDHRIAMAFGVLGLQVPGITIRHAECVTISFPQFWEYILRS